MNRKQRRAVLKDYAAGKVSRTQAISRLGFDHYGQLLDALRKEGMKRPRVPAQVEEKLIHTVMEAAQKDEPLGLTVAELRRHFDFVLDILPWERLIRIGSGARAFVLVSLLDDPAAPVLITTLVRWRIFETAHGERFVMGAASDGTSRGPISFRDFEAATMRISCGGRVYELVGPPAYDDQVQYQLETGWSVDRNARDVSAKVCREQGVRESVIASYEDGEGMRKRPRIKGSLQE